MCTIIRFFVDLLIELVLHELFDFPGFIEAETEVKDGIKKAENDAKEVKRWSVEKFGNIFSKAKDWVQGVKNKSISTFRPHVDINQNKDAITVLVDIPGTF